MLKYYSAFVERIKPLPPEHQFSDFYFTLEGQKNGKLLFVTVDGGLEYILFTSTLGKWLTKN